MPAALQYEFMAASLCPTAAPRALGVMLVDEFSRVWGPNGLGGHTLAADPVGGGGGGATTFSALTDKATADLPATNTPLSTALALKAPLASPTFTGTVGGISAAMVGLGSVDNTADTAKPVSTAQATAIALKADLASPTFTGTVGGISAAMVGLGSVNNTADTAKPVSTAQATAIALKAPLASPTFTGTVGGISAAMVGLGSVDNTADSAKPVSTAQATALALKQAINTRVNIADQTVSVTLTASSTVDVVGVECLAISQTTASKTLTLPFPTVTTVHQNLTVENVGTVAFTISGADSFALNAGESRAFRWNGTNWKLAGTNLTTAQAAAVVSASRNLQSTARYEIFPAVAPVITSSSVTGLSTQTVVIDGVSYLAITATGGTSGWVETQWHSLATTFAGDSAIIEYKNSDPLVWTTINVFLAETTSYAIFALAAQTFASPTGGSPFNHSGTNAYCPTTDLWSKTGYTRGSEEQLWGVAKLRINIANGATGTFYLRSVSVGAQRGYGRLAVTLDDGYSSQYRLGLPVLESYGITATFGIIPSIIGTAGFMTLAQLQDCKARGHQIVAHGPDTGVGNLFSRWATDADAMADVAATRDYIVANGLDSLDLAASKCYVWPQGNYARTAGQSSFLETMRSNGFRTGRTASPSSSTFYLQGRSIARNLDGRLTQGIIGHTYAGATNTPDDATETTNITTITGRITTLRNTRKDGFLMLHDFCRRGAATSGGLFIEMDRLHTLCAAIRTGVQAGDLRQVPMSHLLDE